jgi:hypothetical protein
MTNPVSAMPESFCQDLAIPGNRYPFKDMVLCVFEGGIQSSVQPNPRMCGKPASRLDGIGNYLFTPSNEIC